MRHFVKIAESLDTSAIVAEIERRPEAWHADTSRQENLRCQRHTLSIPLRSARRDAGEEETPTKDVHGSAKTRMAENFPRTVELCEETAKALDAWLARAMIVALAPQRTVLPHIDTGAYYAVRDRLHLVLLSPDGSTLHAGGETVTMQEDELWAFDNKVRHSAENPGDVPRIHLIFDIEPKHGTGWFTRAGGRVP